MQANTPLKYPRLNDESNAQEEPPKDSAPDNKTGQRFYLAARSFRLVRDSPAELSIATRGSVTWKIRKKSKEIIPSEDHVVSFATASYTSDQDWKKVRSRPANQKFG